ncbi:MAG: hypothetical protein WBD27_01955 [Pyrinomonadaceae bacterium]
MTTLRNLIVIDKSAFGNLYNIYEVLFSHRLTDRSPLPKTEEIIRNLRALGFDNIASRLEKAQSAPIYELMTLRQYLGRERTVAPEELMPSVEMLMTRDDSMMSELGIANTVFGELVILQQKMPRCKITC